MMIAELLPRAAIGQEFLYTLSTNGHLHRNDRVTGATIQMIGVVPISNIGVMGMAIYNGEFYALDQGNDLIIKINPQTAQVISSVHVADPSGNVVSEGDFAISPQGEGFYSESNNLLERVDITTGAASIVNSAFLSNIDGLAFGPGGTLYAFQDITGGGVHLYTVNKNTGASTLIGGSPSVTGSIGAL